MDLKRISHAIKKHTKKLQEGAGVGSRVGGGEESITISINEQLKRMERKRAKQSLLNSTAKLSSSSEMTIEPKSIYLRFNINLKGKDRYQFELLQEGNKVFQNILPIRGTLNDEKLDYFTWRLHNLWIEQLDKEEEIEEEQEEEQEQILSSLPRLRNDSNSSCISSSSFSSNSTDRNSSSITTATTIQSNCNEIENKPSSIAMTRIQFSSDLNSINEPGWIDERVIQQQQKQQSSQDYFRHNIISNEHALAAIPLLERDERIFKDQKEIDIVALEEDENRRHSNDSLFDQFYDLSESIQSQPHYDGGIGIRKDSNIKPIITLQDLNEFEEREQQQEQEMEIDQSILPPPLLPASMFHRASFGFRQQSNTKRSNSSISITKLKNLFSTSLILDQQQQDKRRPKTLARAQSEPIAQLV